MVTLAVTTGPETHAPVAAITDRLFGARYLSFHNEDRFLAQTAGYDPGLIVWPGGHLSETRVDRYGPAFPGLYAESTGMPDLAEMMEIATRLDAALAVTLPTWRYAGDPTAAAAAIRPFLADLLSGRLGALPRELIFEIGSEYYAHFTGPTPEADYATVATSLVREIEGALADPAVNLLGADLTLALQAGRTLATDAALRAALPPDVIGAADMIVHHRFAVLPQGATRAIADLEAIRDAWAEASAAAGDDTPPGVFLSAFNVAQITRDAALDAWLQSGDPDAAGLGRGDVDLAARTTPAFETYWQGELARHAYGLPQATLLLEKMTGYLESGLSAAAVFGFDVQHPGRLSWRDAARTDHLMPGGRMMQMLRESLVGTRPILGEAPYDPRAAANAWAFEGEDTLVVFLAAGARPPGEVVLDVDGLGTALTSVRADRLTAEVLPDWYARFGVTDRPEIDETPEAQTFAIGRVTGAEVAQGAQGLLVTLGSAFEVVRLAFAKTPAGEAQIARWSEGAQVDLWPLPPGPEEEPSEAPPPEEADGDDGGAGAGIGMAAILAVLAMLAGVG